MIDRYSRNVEPVAWLPEWQTRNSRHMPPVAAGRRMRTNRHRLRYRTPSSTYLNPASGNEANPCDVNLSIYPHSFNVAKSCNRSATSLNAYQWIFVKALDMIPHKTASRNSAARRQVLTPPRIAPTSSSGRATGAAAPSRAGSPRIYSNKGRAR